MLTCCTASPRPGTRREKQAAEAGQRRQGREPTLHVTDNGQRVPLDPERLEALIATACRRSECRRQPEPIVAETLRNLYDGVPLERGLQGLHPGRPHAASRKTPTTPTSPPACCCTPSCAKSWAAMCSPLAWQAAYADSFPASSRRAWTTSCSTPSC